MAKSKIHLSLRVANGPYEVHLESVAKMELNRGVKIDSYIQSLCDQIVREFNPHKVILFGSYARGKPNEDSDIDLLVIMPYEGNELDKMAEVRGELISTLPLDVLVKTPTQVEQRLKVGDFFVKEIMESGKVLYDARNLGLDR